MRPGGQPNLQQLMKEAQKMQRQLATAQAELAEAEVTGTAGGGLVTVTMTGAGEFRAVKIDPKAVDPDDVETLEDLVLAAVHNAADAARQLTEEKVGPLNAQMGGLGGGLTRDVRGRHPGPDRRVGTPARYRAEECPTARLPPTPAGFRRRGAAGQRVAPGQRDGPVLFHLLQRGRR